MTNSEGSILIQEAPEPRILSMVKFTDYAMDFRAGHLRLGSAESYRNFEDDSALRNDRAELLSHLFQPDKWTIELNGICLQDICGPVEFRRNFEHRTYLLCMCALIDRFLNSGNGVQKLSPDLIQLGSQAVVINNVCEFKRRVKDAALRNGHLRAYPGANGMAAKLVEYIDFDSFDGPVGPFRKSNRYASQMEWRIALVDARELISYPDHTYLDIGDISDISSVHDSSIFIEGVIKAVPRSGARPLH